MIHKVKSILMVILFSGIAAVSYSQLKSSPDIKHNLLQSTSGKGRIYGKLIDNDSKQAVEFASVVLFNAADSLMINGTLSGLEGNFEFKKVAEGSYYLLIDFIGYEKKFLPGIIIDAGHQDIDLGVISIAQAALNLEGVEITAQEAFMEYKVDKKVVNVSQQLNATGGTASEVLESVPSIQVDLEGNVSLRGSSDFLVLIDGKPTILSGSDALNQIPASTIENIEVITNPSAKYDPDGTAGIINVILKKQSLKGLSANASLSAGTGPQKSGMLALNYRTGKFSFNLGANLRDRGFDNERISYRESYLGDTTSFLKSIDNGSRIHDGYSFKGSIDYDLSDNNTISLGGEIGTRNFSRLSETHYEQWSSLSSEKTYYVTDDDVNNDSKSWQIMLNDQHKFKGENHKLDINLILDHSDRDQIEDLQSYYSDADNNIIGQAYLLNQNLNLQDRYRFRAEFDYSRPLGDLGFLEAGYQFRYNQADIEYVYQDWDFDSNTWTADDDMSNEFDFNRQIHALYATASYELGAYDVKAGLRAEYTDRMLDQISLGKDYAYESIDLYPSLYLTRHLPYNQQLQLSYSRRVNRPREFFLNPITFFSDGFNAFQGNPDLEPDFANSFELNYQKYFGKSFISLESYYRQTNNKMTRTSMLNDEGIMIMSMDNLDHDYSLGVELMGNANIAKWWQVILSGSIYKYHLEGGENSNSVVKNSNNWRLRLTSMIGLFPSTKMQLMGSYDSPTVTLDGERDGRFMSSASVRQSFLDNKLRLTLSVMDLFGTMKHEFTNIGENYLTENEFSRESPIFNISLNYIFNNYKDKNASKGSNSDDSDMDIIF